MLPSVMPQVICELLSMLKFCSLEKLFVSINTARLQNISYMLGLIPGHIFLVRI